MTDTIEIILVMAPDGQMQAAVPNGATFEQAAPALKKLFAQLGVDGLPVVLLGEPEKHTHGPTERARVDGVSFASRQRT